VFQAHEKGDVPVAVQAVAQVALPVTRYSKRIEVTPAPASVPVPDNVTVLDSGVPGLVIEAALGIVLSIRREPITVDTVWSAAASTAVARTSKRPLSAAAFHVQEKGAVSAVQAGSHAPVVPVARYS
jgi:hypothetical protein